MKKKLFWKEGQKALFARMTGVSLSCMSDILHRRRGLSPERALEFEDKGKLLLDPAPSYKDWMLNRYSKHPAFFGKSKRLK